MSELRRIETLIIGAGPAGLAAAMELSKAGRPFLVLERDQVVGGLSKTLTFTDRDGDVFHTDNGPHRFFSKNPYLYEFVGDLLDERWITVDRQTRQFIDGKFYDYPVKPAQALRNVGLVRAFRMVFDYGIARIQYGIFRKKIETFEDYVLANFGRTLGNFNMINYTEKIWGIPAGTIHMDWATQRIKGLSLRKLVTGIITTALARKGSDVRSLVDNFKYPDLGTGLIYEKIRERIVELGNQVLTGVAVTGIRTEGERIIEVRYTHDGVEHVVIPNQVIESVPIGSFLRLLNPAPPAEVLQAVSELTYRAQRYVFLMLARETVTPDQWIYFPNKDVRIGRMSEMKNFSPLMSPEGKTSLFLEYFCTEGDEIWTMPEEELVALAVDELTNMGFIRPEEVTGHAVYGLTSVYPVYDVDYQPRLQVLKDYLDRFTNLFYIGRPGRFRYNNQDHSLEMGILAAKSVIDGERYDIESVGMELDYFESGNLPGSGSVERFGRLRKWAPWLLLGLSLLINTVFLARDLPYSIHGDEPSVVYRALAMGTGDLNPHFFVYPSLWLYVLFAVQSLSVAAAFFVGAFTSVDQVMMTVFTSPTLFFLVSRIAAAVAGAFAVYVTYKLAERFTKAGAFVAALAVALFSPFVLTAHLAITDVPMMLLCAISFYFTLRMTDREANFRMSWLLAAVTLGLAVSTKYTAGVFALPFAVALLVRHRKDWRSFAFDFVIGGFLAVAAFVATSPFLLLDHAAAVRDFAYINQYTLETDKAFSALYYLELLWRATGIPLMLAAILGAWRMFRRHRDAAIVALSMVAVYGVILQLTHYKADRFLLPLFPLLTLLAALGYAEVRERLQVWHGMRRTAGLVVLIAALFAVPAYHLAGVLHGLSVPPPERQARAWVLAHVPAGETIFEDGWARTYLPPSRETIERRLDAWRSDQTGRAAQFVRPYELLLEQPLGPGYDLLFTTKSDVRAFSTGLDPERDYERFRLGDADYVVTSDGAINSENPVIRDFYRYVYTRYDEAFATGEDGSRIVVLKRRSSL